MLQHGRRWLYQSPSSTGFPVSGFDLPGRRCLPGLVVVAEPVADRLDGRQGVRGGEVLGVLVEVVEPGQTGPRVRRAVHGRRGRRLAGDAAPLGRRHEVHEHPAGGALGPRGERPVVPVDLLTHGTADAQTHRRPRPLRPGRAAGRGRGGHRHGRHGYGPAVTPDRGDRRRRPLRPAPLLLAPLRQFRVGQRERLELYAAPHLLAGDLALDGGAQPERHRHELADRALARVDAVQPGLTRQHHIVLRLPRQPVAPRLARHRAHLAHTHLQRGGLRRAAEAQPHRLAQIHRQQHPTARPPGLRHRVGVVGDPADRELAEPRRQRMRAGLRQAEGADEPNGHTARQPQCVPVDPHTGVVHAQPPQHQSSCPV